MNHELQMRLQSPFQADHAVDDGFEGLLPTFLVAIADEYGASFDAAGAFAVERLPFEGTVEGRLDRLAVGFELFGDLEVFVAAIWAAVDVAFGSDGVLADGVVELQPRMTGALSEVAVSTRRGVGV